MEIWLDRTQDYYCAFGELKRRRKAAADCEKDSVTSAGSLPTRAVRS